MSHPVQKRQRLSGRTGASEVCLAARGAAKVFFGAGRAGLSALPSPSVRPPLTPSHPKKGDRETERQTDIRDIRDIKTQRQIQTQRQRDRVTEIQRDREIERQKDRKETEKQRHKETETDRQTN